MSLRAWQVAVAAVARPARALACRHGVGAAASTEVTGSLTVRRFATSGDASPRAAFDAACATAGPRVATEGSAAEKLRAYALYKQATSGDAAGARPGLLDMVARAKFDAWAGVRGMTREDAMRAYVSETAKFAPAASGAMSAQRARFAKPRARRTLRDAALPRPRLLPAAAGAAASPLRGAEPTPPGAFAPVRTAPMLPPGTFAGTVALVTGGGTGLGRAMATTLSALGATVVIASRKLDVCAATAAEITAATGGRVVALAVDVRDPAAVAALVDGVVAATGSLPGIVVNNAAGAGRGWARCRGSRRGACAG